ncbi:sensor histidine kinase [Cohnella herbarum]|uniref:Histidine kinase n=1 Tax=Cohnella herbarum TaxID=2728023 RepID=A0A7Z2ZKC8_9BACL|nr:histidine kinase [Cohnella herbarum]QJD82838.1 histidine kinase [Cohnella herbarum]
MRQLKPFLHSLRFKLFAVITLIMAPLIALLIINNAYSIDVVRNQVAQSNKNMLSLYMNQIDRNLQEVDNYLFNLSETETDLLELNKRKSENETVYTLAKLRIFQDLLQDITYYPSIDSFFVYSEPNEELIMTQTFGDTLEARETVKSDIVAMIEQASDDFDFSQWHAWKGKRDYHMFHLIKTGDVYVGAWVNSKKLIVPLSLIDLGESGAALLATDRLIPINHAELVEDNGIDLRFSKDSYSLSGKHAQYLVMGETSKEGGFSLIALVPESEILERLPDLQRISTLISIAGALFLLLFLYAMRRVFLLPIKSIVVAMRKLQGGKWDARLEKASSSTEFELMNETFNRMIGEIHELKINVYEEKLNHQRAELRHLQLQINPHFFLNSLNIIYNLATVRDYALIQEMSKCLVAYFRFMFRSSSYFVSLRDELKHSANYLRIQELRFPGIFAYRLDSPDSLLDIEVPPLVIQTIVENTIKHAVSIDKPIRIDVEVALEHADADGAPIVAILIRDTGPGFSEEALRRLKDAEGMPGEEGEHIGIWNVKRRLRLLYQDKASIAFYNERQIQGATVRITLPVQSA